MLPYPTTPVELLAVLLVRVTLPLAKMLCRSCAAAVGLAVAQGHVVEGRRRHPRQLCEFS